MTTLETLPFPRRDNTDAISTADEWLTYIYSGQASAAGKIEFKAWLAYAEENIDAYEAAEQLWRDLGLICLVDEESHPAAEIQHNLTTLPLAVNQEKSRNPRKHWALALAASIVLIFTITTIWVEQNPQAQIIQYSSIIGEIKTITLPDNSSVVLSADSVLNVDYRAHTRVLSLLRGRAYFEVSPDPSRPFMVSADNTKATALGTAFDINIHDEGVTVAVTHGLVDVRSFLDIAENDHINQSKIEAGQLVHADKHGALSATTTFDIDHALTWRSGRLAYEGQKLSVITTEINRYRTKKIRLLDKALQNKRITLSIPVDKTEQIIRAIQSTESVRVVDTPNEILISLVKTK
ncbi:FecR domain-containing protein [Paraglaciecola sp.]|uniref:FecR family protein n=1 Tax=Paraglaciecola sp. TaxID=1920173 RepID=UPI0030F4B184